MTKEGVWLGIMERRISDKRGKKKNKYKAIEEKPTGGGGGV